MYPTKTAPWLWTHDRVVRVLGNHVAAAMVAGGESPVAVRVLERLATAKGK